MGFVVWRLQRSLWTPLNKQCPSFLKLFYQCPLHPFSLNVLNPSQSILILSSVLISGSQVIQFFRPPTPPSWVGCYPPPYPASSAAICHWATRRRTTRPPRTGPSPRRPGIDSGCCPPNLWWGHQIQKKINPSQVTRCYQVRAYSPAYGRSFFPSSDSGIGRTTHMDTYEQTYKSHLFPNHSNDLIYSSFWR